MNMVDLYIKLFLAIYSFLYIIKHQIKIKYIKIANRITIINLQFCIQL